MKSNKIFENNIFGNNFRSGIIHFHKCTHCFCHIQGKQSQKVSQNEIQIRMDKKQCSLNIRKLDNWYFKIEQINSVFCESKKEIKYLSDS